jgi:hypothetical protein
VDVELAALDRTELAARALEVCPGQLQDRAPPPARRALLAALAALAGRGAEDAGEGVDRIVVRLDLLAGSDEREAARRPR